MGQSSTKILKAKKMKSLPSGILIDEKKIQLQIHLIEKTLETYLHKRELSVFSKEKDLIATIAKAPNRSIALEKQKVRDIIKTIFEVDAIKVGLTNAKNLKEHISNLIYKMENGMDYNEFIASIENIMFMMVLIDDQIFKDFYTNANFYFSEKISGNIIESPNVEAFLKENISFNHDKSDIESKYLVDFCERNKINPTVLVSVGHQINITDIHGMEEKDNSVMPNMNQNKMNYTLVFPSSKPIKLLKQQINSQEISNTNYPGLDSLMYPNISAGSPQFGFGEDKGGFNNFENRERPLQTANPILAKYGQDNFNSNTNGSNIVNQIISDSLNNLQKGNSKEKMNDYPCYEEFVQPQSESVVIKMKELEFTNKPFPSVISQSSEKIIGENQDLNWNSNKNSILNQYNTKISIGSENKNESVKSNNEKSNHSSIKESIKMEEKLNQNQGNPEFKFTTNHPINTQSFHNETVQEKFQQRLQSLNSLK